MKILILSDTEWNDSNSFGNSFSNIFGGIEGIEIANVYCRSALPKTKTCKYFFQISEKKLFKNLLDHNFPSGSVVQPESPDSFSVDTFSNNQLTIVDFIRRKRWIILYWLRDLIWLIGRWKSKELNKFLDVFNPDLIFLPIYYSVYLNKIGLYIKEYTKKPMSGYISDDCYTLRQFSLSPFYWIDRFIKRRWVKKAVEGCASLNVISEIQKKDYDLIFSKDCRLLFKGGSFNATPKSKISEKGTINLVYTGNLGSGRYKILSAIGEVLDNLNSQEIKTHFDITSQTAMTGKMLSELNSKNSITFHGAVSHDKMKEIQNNADIFVHVESFELQSRLETRHSFSTKIVDYFQEGKPIFAVGWAESASIDYLYKNDAAIIAFNESEIMPKLKELIENREIIAEYAMKSYDCGKRNHQLSEIQNKLINHFNDIVKNKK